MCAIERGQAGTARWMVLEHNEYEMETVMIAG